MRSVDPLSVIPLRLLLTYKGRSVGQGTGFTVSVGDLRFLITNLHVVDDPKCPVDAIEVMLHSKVRLGSWVGVRVRLADPGGRPFWHRHPAGPHIDLAAVPLLGAPDTIQYHDLDLALADVDVLVGPSEPASILGFPHGLASDGAFPVWKTGHVASDLDLDALGLPIFLIDARTKQGMSGAPVFARRLGSWTTSHGLTVGGSASRFLGVYSGRVEEPDLQRMDIGIVWKVSVLRDLLSNRPPMQGS